MSVPRPNVLRSDNGRPNRWSSSRIAFRPVLASQIRPLSSNSPQMFPSLFRTGRLHRQDLLKCSDLSPIEPPCCFAVSFSFRHFLEPSQEFLASVHPCLE